MRIGMIGTGNMGRILAEALMDGNAISPSSMIITNRTLSKAKEIQRIYPEIRVAKGAVEAAACSDLIFICVKPHDVYGVLQEIKGVLDREKCVISITSPISVEEIESVVECSSARVIPSITNRALAGVTLFTYGKNCSPYWKHEINKMFEKISKPLEINGNITRVASDIVSCGPAFFSYLTQRFIDAAVNETEIDKETATNLAGEMLIGLGELLRKGFFTLPALQEKVCVKGGITGEGIKVLEQETEDMFELLFRATHLKFREDLNKSSEQFGSNINS
ncbi:late competence protein ComER [Mesobacillus zeae]|uniref:Late competence protein ComER n=1 Tax=Mesobacillus zeae TaxID=1917180 RepID=A0A398B1G7_9BACI|nr:late competence protein ComER [Mesobacillus zeae]RID83779.1 late competence protein ComER [Mesobacillus zeae]